MAKRYLTDQQKARIKEHKATLEGHRGLLIAHFGSYVDIETPEKTIKRCQLRQSLPTLVVGDEVLWEQATPEKAVVIAQLPRKTVLFRPDSRGHIKPVAANIDQIIIVFAVQPAMSLLLLDSYLVASELNQIQPIIVVNKVDLMTPFEQPLWDKQLQIYQQLNYPIFLVSSEKNEGLDALGKQMQSHVSVFVGQSGVGKSSLIQHWVPDATLAVGEISAFTNLGRHTTTTSRLYHLSEGGEVIDSPGVREFGLGKVNAKQLMQGFIELTPYQGLCKFRNCRHLTEPGCALQEAVNTGKIAPSRFQHFKKLLGQLDE